MKTADKLFIRLSKLPGRQIPFFQNRKVKMEFHVSRESRIKYQFDESLFSSSGNVIFPNFRASRQFAQKMNAKRDLINFPEKTVRAGQINAMGLIDEILHYVVELYREQKQKTVAGEALLWLEKSIGKAAVDTALRRFAVDFPPLEVYRNETDLDDYLKGKTVGISNREILLEELLLLWLANRNTAFSPFGELFDDENLEKNTLYPKLMDSLHDFFDSQPAFGPDNENLIDMLRSPAIAEPHSLSGQLEYIRKKWGLFLGKYLYRMLSSLDLIKEEEKAMFMGPGPARVYEFGLAPEDEPERFSPDKDWMPRTVILAKSTFVWLDQLSKKYQKNITRLDEIPDEELDQLAGWGFSGLWLIGVWERSRASKKIKQMCGNPEAVASAYSLFDYQIAQELGGEEAFTNLKERAWKRGIRMAGDMVPNHMGIDSSWLIDHPDWFISLDYSPYPNHTFNGPNLSWDDRVGIYLEDHYYSRSDAAVTFKRVDHYSGDTKYIYHGNDGTSMPWNDTAQLNYLKPEVREAVIQTILNVARKFPIIRFDAAMTLTKKHYQRLWFPEPGTGGDIPTRSEHSMTKPDFDNAIPEEFWREVVDRVAKEVPDTLLLAEAFWLMESYFVRTLGMHRVYNSAFMNMLKNEENDKYRASIKNVLEFNPEILKRFVNFMNNPDEDTAIAQFGTDDKYFGVCMMMITMPGLPMFGHGQVEGYKEKYGMEYRRAYWDEQPNWGLIQRHEREIFPLMRKRHIFAEVGNFYLYDFYTTGGYVNENVFAYSNRRGDERGLVVYNNKFENTSGWIKNSVTYLEKGRDGNDDKFAQKNLGEGLGLHNQPNYYLVFRDHVSGLQFIRNSEEIHRQGLFVELGAFKYQVFLDFYEIEDNQWNHYGNLAAYLDGRGVPSIEEALKETFLQPIHHPFKEVVNHDYMKWIIGNLHRDKKARADKELVAGFETKMSRLLSEIRQFSEGTGNPQKVAGHTTEELKLFLNLPVLEQKLPCPDSRKYQEILKTLKNHLPENDARWFVLLGWLIVHRLGAAVEAESYPEQSRSGIDEWLLGKILENSFRSLGFSQADNDRSVLIIKILTRHQAWWDEAVAKKHLPYQVMEKLLRDAEVRSMMQVNRYHEVLWYNKESFDELLSWLLTVAVLQEIKPKFSEPEKTCKSLTEKLDLIKKIRKAEKKSEFKVSKLLEGLKA